MATKAEQGRARPVAGNAPDQRWHSRAFGLEIEGSFPAPGLPPVDDHRDGPRTILEEVAPEAIDAGWPVDGAERLMEEWLGGGTPARTIDFHPRVGYRLYARRFGLARVDADGSRVRCAPPGVSPWNWQRFLVGRVLPWAALLRGLEVFHASAVALGDRVVAIIGPTGAGKTSLGVQLMSKGAGFVTDDVLAVDRREGELRAHPGAGIVGVRPDEKQLLGQAGIRRLGRVLGHSDKTYVAVDRHPHALRLGIVYFLSWQPEAVAAEIEPLPAPDPRLLLTSTFVFSVQTPDRLRNQLEICAELARSIPVFTAGVTPGVGAAALAGKIDSHARSVLGVEA